MKTPIIIVKKNSVWGKVLAGIGVATILSEVVLRIVTVFTDQKYEMDHWVIAIGAIIGFAGFWSIDDKKTKAATEIITGVVPRFGRRSTDAIAVPQAKTEIKSLPTGEHATMKPDPSDPPGGSG